MPGVEWVIAGAGCCSTGRRPQGWWPLRSNRNENARNNLKLNWVPAAEKALLVGGRPARKSALTVANERNSVVRRQRPNHNGKAGSLCRQY